MIHEDEVSVRALVYIGVVVEHGFDAQTVDDAHWTEALHLRPSIWGHRRG